MLGDLQPWHIILIVVVFVLLFGSKKLPGAARSVGQSLRIFKSEMREAAKDDGTSESEAARAPQAVEAAKPTPAKAAEPEHVEHS